MIVTIDGPAASGKSSVAQELGKRLGLFHLRTGLLYRAVAYILVHDFRKKINWDVPVEFAPEDLTFIKDITYKFIDTVPHVFFKNTDITSHLSLASLDQMTSIISASKAVRKVLLDVQRKIAEQYNIIADGRDCGSVVFPSADYKFFLTASAEQRAARVTSDASRKEDIKDVDKIMREIEIRDKRDQEREVAPLTIPVSAIIIDSSNLGFEQTIQEFLKYIK
jgi:cytidylate kinase